MPQSSARRLGLFWLVLTGICLVSGAPLFADDASTPPPYVTPADVKTWLAQGRLVTFVDVREPDEFEAGHLPGALNVPQEQVVATAATLPRDQAVVLYCIHSAHRAPEAAKALRQLGFTNAYVLEGGIVAWQAGGLTIRASDLARAPAILPKTDRCEQVKSSRQ